MDKLMWVAVLIGCFATIYLGYNLGFVWLPNLNDDSSLSSCDTHILEGYFNNWTFNWGKGGYLIYIVNASIDGIDIPQGDYTLHWFSDIDGYSLDDFVGEDVVIQYCSDAVGVEWNGFELSIIDTIELKEE